jgi:hypothetical protein
LTPISQWNKIRDNDLTQGNDTTTSDTLYSSPDQHVGEVVADRSDNGANTEEKNGD